MINNMASRLDWSKLNLYIQAGLFVSGLVWVHCESASGNIDDSDRACLGEMCYTVIEDSLSWEEADAHCRTQGSALIKIDDGQVYEHIKGMLNDNGQANMSYWIGAHAATARKPARCGYIEHTDEGRPDTKLEWTNCFLTKSVICSVPKSLRQDCPVGFTKSCLWNLCIHVDPDKKNWFLARQECRKLGGDLVHVDGEVSKSDFGYIVNSCMGQESRRTKRSPRREFEAWNRQGGISWIWTDGTNVTFTAWFEEGTVTPSEPVESCVILRWRPHQGGPRLGYVDKACTEKNHFICGHRKKNIDESLNEEEGNHEETTRGPRPGGSSSSSQQGDRRRPSTPPPPPPTKDIPDKALYIGIGVGIAVVVLVLILLIVFCLRRYHKKEIQRVILRANSNVYRNNSQIDNTGLANMSSVNYNGYADLAVVTNGHAYQDLNSRRDSGVYEDIPVDSIDNAAEGMQTGSPHSPSASEAAPRTTGNAALPPHDVAAVSSGYDYIDDSQVSALSSRPGLPVPQHTYLQILPPTPLASPRPSPKPGRNAQTRQEAADGEQGPKSSVDARQNPNKSATSKDESEEEECVFVVNDAYEPGGWSSNKEVITISSQGDRASSSF